MGDQHSSLSLHTTKTHGDYLVINNKKWTVLVIRIPIIFKKEKLFCVKTPQRNWSKSI